MAVGTPNTSNANAAMRHKKTMNKIKTIEFVDEIPAGRR